VRYAHVRNTDSPLAAVVDDRVVALGGRLDGIATLDALVAAGPEAWAAAEAIAAEGGDGPALDDVELDAPIATPSKIVCVGLNYHDHCVETGVPVPERPLLFAKFPSTITGPRDVVTWPESLTEQVDWEAELAVVIGRRLKDAAADDVLDAVFGYTAANDVSARDLQFGDGQWTRGKSIDTFCPLGPVVVTADEYGDPQGRRLGTRVNGKTVQDSSTDHMIFDVRTILSFASQALTLEPGDLVLTGTPAGCGAFRSPPVYLSPGDVVEVDVEGIGVLRNPIGTQQ
jgi:2-keto-4-pentenoate hydratase/2-oxohepta-3-ene-1,7-dioic acid hydratase in catechol pathway